MYIAGILPYKEKIAAKVHDSWWKEKKQQGFHAPKDCELRFYEPMETLHEEILREHFCNKCHRDMIPYQELPEDIKDYDRVTVQTVLEAIRTL